MAEDDQRPTLDAIYGPEDVDDLPIGEPTEEEQREQDLIDEMPSPGFPVDEAERRSKWSKIPRPTRAAIHRLHIIC